MNAVNEEYEELEKKLTERDKTIQDLKQQLGEANKARKSKEELGNGITNFIKILITV